MGTQHMEREVFRKRKGDTPRTTIIFEFLFERQREGEDSKEKNWDKGGDIRQIEPKGGYLV